MGTAISAEPFWEHALLAGRTVTLLSRQIRSDFAGVRRVAWRLGDDIPAQALDADRPPHEHALVHFAHDWRETRDGDLNVDGSHPPKASAHALGVGRCVFISSLSARQDALNAYGRIEWKIEQIFGDAKTCPFASACVQRPTYARCMGSSVGL